MASRRREIMPRKSKSRDKAVQGFLGSKYNYKTLIAYFSLSFFVALLLGLFVSSPAPSLSPRLADWRDSGYIFNFSGFSIFYQGNRFDLFKVLQLVLCILNCSDYIGNRSGFTISRTYVYKVSLGKSDCTSSCSSLLLSFARGMEKRREKVILSKPHLAPSLQISVSMQKIFISPRDIEVFCLFRKFSRWQWRIQNFEVAEFF